MSLPQILQQINRSKGIPDTGIINNPFMDGVRNIVNMAKTAGNKDMLMQQLAAQNPNMKQAVDYVKANGGDPKSACIGLLKQNGIDPNEISKMIGGT